MKREFDMGLIGNDCTTPIQMADHAQRDRRQPRMFDTFGYAVQATSGCG
jgi:hypothetical protein